MPEGAIRGKMRMDKVSDADMDLFFAGKPRPAAAGGAAAGPPVNQLPEFAKYVKMTKMVSLRRGFLYTNVFNIFD